MKKSLPQVRAVDVVRRNFAEQDRAYKLGLAGYAKHGERISCFGCTHDGCCRQSVFVQLIEALPIAIDIFETERDTPELREKLLAEGLGMERAERGEWFDRDRLCVFHNGAGKGCAVYKDRPSACRAYFVVTPPEECGPPSAKKIACLDFFDVISENQKRCQEMHREASLKESPFRLFCCSLPRAVWIWLGALDLANADKPWQKFVNHQPWPSERTIEQWVDAGHDLL